MNAKNLKGIEIPTEKQNTICIDFTNSVENNLHKLKFFMEIYHGGFSRPLIDCWVVKNKKDDEKILKLSSAINFEKDTRVFKFELFTVEFYLHKHRQNLNLEDFLLARKAFIETLLSIKYYIDERSEKYAEYYQDEKYRLSEKDNNVTNLWYRIKELYHIPTFESNIIWLEANEKVEYKKLDLYIKTFNDPELQGNRVVVIYPDRIGLKKMEFFDMLYVGQNKLNFSKCPFDHTSERYLSPEAVLHYLDKLIKENQY